MFHRLTNRPHVRVNAYAEGGNFNGDEPRIALPLAPLQAFDTDAKTAIGELGELALQDGQRVVVLCRKSAERDRLIEARSTNTRPMPRR